MARNNKPIIPNFIAGMTIMEAADLLRAVNPGMDFTGKEQAKIVLAEGVIQTTSTDKLIKRDAERRFRQAVERATINIGTDDEPIIARTHAYYDRWQVNQGDGERKPVRYMRAIREMYPMQMVSAYRILRQHVRQSKANAETFRRYCEYLCREHGLPNPLWDRSFA